MDLACLRSTKTAEKQTHLNKQNLQNPKCKKEGQDGWGQPKRKCNIRLERERERDSRLSQNIDRVYSLTHSLTYLSFFLKLRLIDSTDHQQNSRREETKKHHRPQNRLSVCLSLEKRARGGGGGGEGKRGGG
jgi:hypothetical protein